MTQPLFDRVALIGIGLIGSSIARVMRRDGLAGSIVACARSDATLNAVQRLKLADKVTKDAAEAARDADLVMICTPVSTYGVIAETIAHALKPGAIVTDVGSVKAAIAGSIEDPRFVAGHPMAGSEQDGLDGAAAHLFSGAMWVLCPTSTTDDTVFATIRDVVKSMGANPIAIPADRHDQLVAVISHVPHLTAATLMRLADGRATEERALLRLAAGGFRDMTRIAAGHPAIWPDICVQNADPIVDALDELISELSAIRDVVSERDRAALLARLESARVARRNLPTTIPSTEAMSEMRVPVLDRQGELAAIATLAADLDVNIYDLEIAHSAEGPRGVVVLVVETATTERLQGGLMALGYRPSSRSLEA